MNERPLIEKCVEIIEKKLNWGRSENWTNHDFDTLSSQLSNISKISISVKTVKRLFGRIKYKDSYNPQPDTKKALALFMDYQGWDDFKVDMEIKGVQFDNPLSQTKENEIKSNSNRVYQKSLIYIPIFLIICVLLVYYTQNTIPKNNNSTPLIFKANYTKGNVPHTVVFNYDVSKILSDSIIIDFGNKKELLSKQNKIITHLYTIPDYYNVKLSVNDKIINKTGVHVLSQGWKTYIHDNKKHSEVRHNAIANGKISILPKDVLTIIDTNKYYKVKYRNIRDYEANADDFTLVTKVQSDITKGVGCHRVTLRIAGVGGDLLFALIQPGCFERVDLRFSELSIHGKYADLSSFEKNLSQWVLITLKVKNKRVYIYNDGKLIHESVYKRPIGRIKGLNFTFFNNGAIDFIKLYDKNNKLVYNDEFSEPIM